MKVGDLVRVKETWIQACEEFKSRYRKVALVTQDWDTHDNFAVIFMGETEEVDFNDSNAWSDEFMEKVP